MTKQITHRPTQPFVMYSNGLEMFGRVIESSCKLSVQMMEIMEKAAREAAQSATEDGDSSKSTPAKAVTTSMIPDSGDLQASSAAVAAAMNEAARRNLGALPDDEAPRENMRDAIARAKSAISAVKPRSGN